ncbi:MAG: hypothetical protein R3A44_06370 [Caldilineaceae bacterium]
MDPPSLGHKSFIVRCYLLAPPADHDQQAVYGFILIDPQTGARIGFPSFSALVAHLEVSLQQAFLTLPGKENL